MAQTYDCWACGGQGSYHVRVDKRGRGYWACGACNHRVFTYTGLAFFMQGEMAKAITAQRGTWQAAARAQMAAMFGPRADAMTWRQVTQADLASVGMLS